MIPSCAAQYYCNALEYDKEKSFGGAIYLFVLLIYMFYFLLSPSSSSLKPCLCGQVFEFYFCTL